jgi:methyl coenzyme M reductase subunit C-like uncharacterized protein (methanogenesis marker protein 7)
MCVHGGACSSYAPGHALHLIQVRLAAATPSEWTDAVVAAVDAARGEIVVQPLSGAAVVVWSAAGAAEHTPVGEPVALHARYDVLWAAGRRFNVARVG